MTRTDVTLVNNRGVYVPSMDSVKVVAGDAISFGTSDGSTAYAFFSPDAVSVLTPRPAEPYAIHGSGKSELTFSSSGRGAYSVYFGSDPGIRPGAFPPGSSDVLRLELILPQEPPTFSGGSDTMTSGH